MITIFEGPDGAGKSTLIKAWQRWIEANNRRTNVAIEHITHQHGPYLNANNVAQFYLDSLVTGMSPKRHVLMDRAWVSERVYGPVMRGKDRIGAPERRALERVALAYGAVIVWCIPPYENCHQAYLRRKHLEYLENETQLRDVHTQYGLLARKDAVGDFKQALSSVAYNYTCEPSTSLFIDMVENLRSYDNAGPGVGHFAPDVTLLVGEQVSTNTTAHPDLPFTSWHPGGCASWLSQKLDEWGVSERHLYWVNALTSDGHETSPDGWLKHLHPKQVIALGAVAATWCQRHVPEICRLYIVPHPQFWKRFHHHEEYELRSLLCKG